MPRADEKNSREGFSQRGQGRKKKEISANAFSRSVGKNAGNEDGDGKGKRKARGPKGVEVGRISIPKRRLLTSDQREHALRI